MSKKSIGLALCGLLLISQGCSRAQQNANNTAEDAPIRMEPDEILVSIDGTDLTYGQAIRQVELRLGGPPPEGMDPARVEMIERRSFAAVVDDFIRRELLLAEARRLAIEPAEENIASTLLTIERSTREGAPPPTGMVYEGPDSLRREVVAGLTIEKLLAQALPPFQQPTPDQIEAYLQQFPDLRSMPARARVRHIFLPLTPETNDAVLARTTANLEDIRTRLLEGADFAQTASMVSQDRSASRGGDLGIIIKGRGDPLFDQAAFAQPIGEIGPITRSSAGLHILQVLERTDPRPATTEEIIDIMRRNQRAEAINLYIRTLRKHTEIRHSPAIQPLPDTP